MFVAKIRTQSQNNSSAYAWLPHSDLSGPTLHHVSARNCATQRPLLSDVRGLGSLQLASKRRASTPTQNLRFFALLLPHLSILGQGWTALHYAAQNGSAETVVALVEAGVDMEASNVSGWMDGRDGCVAVLKDSATQSTTNGILWTNNIYSLYAPASVSVPLG